MINLDSRNQPLTTMNGFRIIFKENAQEQALSYGSATGPKVQKPKRKKKIRVKVASEQSPNHEEPVTPVAHQKATSSRSEESTREELVKKNRQAGSAKSKAHATRRKKGKVPGQKMENKRQAGYQHPRQQQHSNQRTAMMQASESESTKSVSSRSRSNSSRLGFDGTISSVTPTNLEKKSREKQLHSLSKIEQQQLVEGTARYKNRSSPPNGAAPNSRRNDTSRQSPVASTQTARSIDRNFSQGNASKNAFGNPDSSIGTKKTGMVHNHGYDGMERPVDDTNANLQTSRFRTRRTVIWGAICCVILIAAIVIPCVLLLVDFSGNDFPKLSSARGVVASITDDICNESVPKSGGCTPRDTNDERQGSELCNLVAKSMLNTTIYGDIALINAGSCKETLFAPKITGGNIKQAIESESLVVVEISGADLADALAGALTTSFGDSANPDAYPYAAGLRYNVEANLLPPERLSRVEVNRNLRSDEYTPIDIRRFYKVVTTESIANGDLGYASFGNIIDDWKEPLNIKSGDAFYNYALKHSDGENWSYIQDSEYSTQYFMGENEEAAIAMVPNRICHATIPGQPTSTFCTAADVAQGSEVCNLLSWMVYDQNFGVDIVLLKGYVCAADIEEGRFVPSSFDAVISENKSLWKVSMPGSSIVKMISTGVAAGVQPSSGGDLHYPYAAGVKFDVIIKPSPTVSNVRVLASGGRWIPIVDTEFYTVATTSDALPSTSTAKDMGTTLKEQLTGYADDWNIFYKMSKDKASTQSYA